MRRTELIIVGGFLGAGKTTSILSMARFLLKKGKRIGIVTNDQGSDLVDTNLLKSLGLSVMEVTGGCFCCNFEEFTNRIQAMSECELPDVILAEPVGSCTDLVATIFKPMKLKYMDTILLRPLSIVADPKRIMKLISDTNTGFPSEINYLFKKQLEEADIIILNKIDRINDEELNTILGYLERSFKGAEVLGVSAIEGTNVEAWVDKLYDMRYSNNRALEIDYDTYAAAESMLGWFNMYAALNTDQEVDANILTGKFMNLLKAELIKRDSEIAHLKVYGISESDWLKASLVSLSEDIGFSKKADKSWKNFNLIINARVNTEPSILRTAVEIALGEVIAASGLQIVESSIDCFKPGRPEPMYRMG